MVLATSMVSFFLPLGGFDDLVEPAGAEPHVGAVPRADDPHLGGALDVRAPADS